MFGPKTYEDTGGRRKLFDEEFREVCSSPSIVRRVKSRRMGFSEHIARIGRKTNTCRSLVESRMEGD
jgi:hypothetical protein